MASDLLEENEENSPQKYLNNYLNIFKKVESTSPFGCQFASGRDLEHRLYYSWNVQKKQFSSPAGKQVFCLPQNNLVNFKIFSALN